MKATQDGLQVEDQGANSVPYQSWDSGGEECASADTSTVCSDCGAVIRNLANVAVHMRRHVGYKPYSCSSCSYSGYDEDDVRRHASRAHMNNGSHVKFKPVSTLETQVGEMVTASKTIGAKVNTSAKSPGEHNLSVLTDSPSKQTESCPPLATLTCDLCKGQSVSCHPWAVISHLKCHLNSTTYYCSECSTPHSSLVALTEHISIGHPGSNIHSVRASLGHAMTALAEVAFCGHPARLQCTLCSKMVVWTRAALKAHVSEHDGRYPFKCTQCGTASVDVLSAWEHWRKHHLGQFPVLSFDVLNNNLEESSPESDALHLLTAFPLLSPESIENLPADVSASKPAGQTVVVEPSGPEDHTVNGNDLTKGSVACMVCASGVPQTISSMVSHVKVHLDYKPLKCDYCVFTHFSMSKIRRHTVKLHKNLPVKVSYHPAADISKRIRNMKIKCFGSISPKDKEDVVSDETPEPDEIVAMDFEETLLSPTSHNSCASPSGSEGSMNDSMHSSLTSPDTRSALFPAMPQPNMSHVLERLIREGIPPTPTASGIFPSMMSPHNILNSMRPMDACKPGEKVVRTGPTATPPVVHPMNHPGGMSTGRHVETYDLNGMGKKVCLMCNTYIANNPSSFDNHACKHLDYKPYHCYYCQYQSYIRGKVTRHIQQVHNGLPVKIDHKPLPGIKDKIQQIKLKCFPFLMGDTGGSGGQQTKGMPMAGTPVEETGCELCGATVLTLPTAMDEHLQAHIAVKYYHCPVCTYQTTYLIRAKQHVHSAHPTSQETRILCCPPEGIQGLQELRIKCFGAKYWVKEEEEEIIHHKEEDGQIQSENHFTIKMGTPEPELSPIKEEQPQQSVGRMTCVLCSAQVSNLPTMMASHVRNHMIDYKPYQCSYCPLKLTTEIEVKQHIMLTHRHVPLKVEYNPERTQLEKMHLACFPLVPSPIVSDLPSSQSTPRSRYEASQAGIAIHAPSSNGGTLLKKLICQLCKNTIADNAKSVGIHVKNHLNYKPYRCPFCKYMSCEQSKARRHVEHVHSVSGDAVEIHAETDIKQRIKEMKSRCFPTLTGEDCPGRESPEDDTADDSNDTFMQCVCNICKTVVPVNMLEDHAMAHAGELRCDHCDVTAIGEDKMREHLINSHPNLPPTYNNVAADINQIKAACFPDTFTPTEEDTRGEESHISNAARDAVVDGKLTCHVCNQLVSVNTNSLEVHAKTHLNFKQHQCGYCNYKSCISGKVKRHIDNVHRGQTVHMLSFNNLSDPLKLIVADTRAACFPQEGPNYASIDTLDREHINNVLQELRIKLVNEIQNMDTEGLDATEITAAQASVCNDQDRPPSVMTPEQHVDTSALFARPGSRAQTPSDNGNTVIYQCNRVQIQCQLCDQQIADNPSSLGLHVRNHLDYKPFSCNLCEYKSPIQAKVKRHLRNVHKCPTDEMSYNPEPDIRAKVTDMKVRCFPRIADAARGILPSSHPSASPLSMVMDESPTLVSRACKPGGVLDSLLSKKTGDWPNTIKCRLCSVQVSDDADCKSQHCASHCTEGQWHCSDCPFSSFIQETVASHALSLHQSGAQPVKYDTDQSSLSTEEMEKLSHECFPESTSNDSGVESASLDGSLNEEELDDVDEDDECSMDEHNDLNTLYVHNKHEDKRMKCSKCEQYVCVTPAAIHMHVKMHVNYRPYACTHCDYHALTRARVRRHVANKHKGHALSINYSPQKDITPQLVDMRECCFPDIPSLTKAIAQDITCAVCRTTLADTPLAKSLHAKHHLNAKPYHCGECTFESSGKELCVQHYRTTHPDSVVRVVLNEEEVVPSDQLHAFMAQCFPPLDNIKLGPAYREYHCPYCPFSDTSKYHIKEHCVTNHPGEAVGVQDMSSH